MSKLVLIIKYIILALVQGFAEILPVSSSGHLLIAQGILGMEEEGIAFEIFLHFASVLAILWFFRKELIDLVRGFFGYLFRRAKDNEEKLEWQKEKFWYVIYLIIATVPAGALGVVVTKLDIIDKYLSSLLWVGIFLYVTGILLLVSSRIKKTKSIHDMKWYDALIIGLFQCLGIFPGISRSGSCFVGAGVRKINHREAATFVFLMAIPMILGSAVFSVGDLVSTLQADHFLFIPYGISFVLTLFVTYFCLKFFLTMIRKQRLSYFAYYCFAMGTFAIALYFVS